MRLRIVLPKVNPEAIVAPTRCIAADCSGRTVHFHQEVRKSLRDTVYETILSCALGGAGRRKSQRTVISVRSPEWVAHHRS